MDTRRPLDARSLVVAGFLSAGSFKSDPRLAWLPVDLTLLLGGLATLLAIYSLAQSREKRLPVTLLWVGGLFALFALPLFWTTWTDYATDKVLRLFTLTLLAAVLPVVLFRTREELRRLLNALALLGFLMALDAGLTLARGGDLERLTAWGSNTLALGAAAGKAAVWTAILWMEGRSGRVGSTAMGWLRAMALGALAVIMLASGSRGSLLALLGTLVLTGLLFYLNRTGTIVRFFAVGAVVFLFIAAGASVAPRASSARVERFVQGDWGRSEGQRVEAYALSLHQIADHPLGLGWGGFEDRVDVWTPRMQYPHNLVLEMALEGGWAVGAAFLGLVGMALARTYAGGRRDCSAELRALFSLTVYFMANSLVSGDINDARSLFACLGLSLGAK